MKKMNRIASKNFSDMQKKNLALIIKIKKA